MSCAGELDLEVCKGATFAYVVRWEAGPTVFKAISAITKAAPPALTVTGHGLTAGWRVAISNVLGMTQLNAENDPPKTKDYYYVDVTDANTIKLRDVDASGFGTYKSGGYIRYNTAVDLSGYTARMKIKDKVGGTVLASTEVGDAPKNIITITLDNTNKLITITITAANTAAVTWTKGVYDLELVSGSIVVRLLEGKVTVSPEVTT